MHEPSTPSRTALQALPPSRAFPPFGALRAFDALVRLGSVKAAAEALSVNRAMINRHLRSLENWTGATLIKRSGNVVGLTVAGREYYEMIAPHIDGIAAATLNLLGPRQDDRLKIWCLPGFATLWLMPRLGRFREANPSLTLDLRAEEAAPNFSLHDADLAIRYLCEYGSRYEAAEGRLAEIPPNVRILELARVAIFPVASPDYLARHPAIGSPADLLGHTLIHEESDSWHPWLASHEVKDLPEPGGPRLWQTDLALSAARHGHGIALANHFSAHDFLAEGHLVRVDGKNGPFAPTIFGAYILIARPDRWASRPVSRFRHWILEMIHSEVDAVSDLALRPEAS
jgi:LysR family glycine cleavage system transcriptional activator